MRFGAVLWWKSEKDISLPPFVTPCWGWDPGSGAAASLLDTHGEQGPLEESNCRRASSVSWKWNPCVIVIYCCCWWWWCCCGCGCGLWLWLWLWLLLLLLLLLLMLATMVVVGFGNGTSSRWAAVGTVDGSIGAGLKQFGSWKHHSSYHHHSSFQMVQICSDGKVAFWTSFSSAFQHFQMPYIEVLLRPSTL